MDLNLSGASHLPATIVSALVNDYITRDIVSFRYFRFQAHRSMSPPTISINYYVALHYSTPVLICFVFFPPPPPRSTIDCRRHRNHHLPHGSVDLNLFFFVPSFFFYNFTCRTWLSVYFTSPVRSFIYLYFI